MRSVLRRLGRAALSVVHDREVQRAGKSLAALVVVRVLIALGAAPTFVQLVRELLGL